jgi:general secretion pathway protein F
MSLYSYKAYARTGQIETGQINANSVRHVAELLNATGLIPFETKEATSDQKPIKSSSLFGLRRAGKPEDLARFVREMATLLRADLPVDQILKILKEQSQGSAMQELANGLSKSLTEGAPLSEGFLLHGQGLPPYCVSLIRAGEARGNLPDALNEVSTLLERHLVLRNKIRSSLTYPALMAVTALAVLAIIVMYLVPALMPLFTDAGIAPPFALYIAEGLGSVVGRNWQVFLLGFASTVLCSRAFLRSARGKAALDHARLVLPLFGPISRNAGIAIFSRTLGTLLRSGVAVIPALKATADTASNGVLANALREATDRVQEGTSLSSALQKTGQMTDLALRFVSVGEAASRLDHMLLQLADVLEKETEAKIERAMSLMTPVLTIAIGVLVGGLILSVMQAILGINQLAVR